MASRMCWHLLQVRICRRPYDCVAAYADVSFCIYQYRQCGPDCQSRCDIRRKAKTISVTVTSRRSHPGPTGAQDARRCHGVPQWRPRRRYHGARRRSSRSPWGLDGSSRLADDGCSMGCTNRLNTEQPNPAPRRVPVLQREPATCALCRLNTFRARTPPALRELVLMGCGLSQVDKVGTGGKDRVQSAWDGGQGSWYVCFLSIVFFHKKEKEGERRERKRKKKVLSSEK